MLKSFIWIAGLLMVVIWAQEVLIQDLPSGQYRGIKKQKKDVPRFYLCGAGVWKKADIIQQPFKCKSKPGVKIKQCIALPPFLRWIWIDGISFNYCHFQNWQAMINQEERGRWDWQGMQMCPENMYVYGFKTKLTERDGVAGLILLCRNSRNSRETRQVLVFDGQGSWREATTSSNFAIGFNAKYKDWRINGLSMQMTPIPYIFAFNFNYQFPKNFNTAPSQIQNVIVENYGLTPISKQIQMFRQKQFSRIWENSKGQLHGTSVSQMFSQSLMSKSTIGIPFLSSTTTTSTQKQELTEGKREEKVETFKFGVIEKFKVGQRQKDVVTVPPCTKYTIRQIVEYTDADVPYTLQIGYTNSRAVEYESISGHYRGIAVGEVKTTVRYEEICSKPK